MTAFMMNHDDKKYKFCQCIGWGLLGGGVLAGVVILTAYDYETSRHGQESGFSPYNYNDVQTADKQVTRPVVTGSPKPAVTRQPRL